MPFFYVESSFGSKGVFRAGSCYEAISQAEQAPNPFKVDGATFWGREATQEEFLDFMTQEMAESLGIEDEGKMGDLKDIVSQLGRASDLLRMALAEGDLPTELQNMIGHFLDTGE